MKACIRASEVLDCDADRRPAWRTIAENLHEYPTIDTPEGKVFIDVDNAPYPYTNYNLPVPAMANFPGEDIGLHSPEPVKQTALRTFKALEEYPPTQGYIMLPMAKVRLGIDVMDEMEKRTRQRCFLNGAVFTDCFRWIWAENFGMPIVVNDSLMQSYTGALRIAPVTLKGGARFAGLRAVGAFLVSGETRPDGTVEYLSIVSEAGAPCTVIKPWSGTIRVRNAKTMNPVAVTEVEGSISFETRKGTTYILDSPDNPWENQVKTCVSAPSAQSQIPEWYRVKVPGPDWTSAWADIEPSKRTPTGIGRFVPTADGAAMYADGPAGQATGWQIATVPIDTSTFARMEMSAHGVGKATVRVEAVGGNGGEAIAATDWTPLGASDSAIALDLPPSRTIVALSVFTRTEDGNPVEARIRSIRFLAAAGKAVPIDLRHISP